MDLHDFYGDKMYFDEALPASVPALLNMASEAYSEGAAEEHLLKAYFTAPESLTVLVALYRYYYYQHRYETALTAAHRAMSVAAKRLGFTSTWESLDMEELGYGVLQSMMLVRFYLLSLKGAGYLNVRIGNMEEGTAMLEKVMALDSEDRLGVAPLLQTIEGYQRRVEANFGVLKLASSR